MKFYSFTVKSIKMKKIVSALLFTLSIIYINSQEVKEPKSKTQFSDEALAMKVTSVSNDSITIQEIFSKHKGKIIFLDIWTSWCKDCIESIPKVKELQQNNPNIVYVFFSLDKTFEKWKKGIEKFGFSGEQYWLGNQWKNTFTDDISLNWIPRYMVIDKAGKIKTFFAIAPDDDRITKALNE